MIARAAAAPPSADSAAAAVGDAGATLSMFSFTPITPVDATSTSDAQRSRPPSPCARPSPARHRCRRAPVQALAQPLLMTTARRVPPLCVRCSRDSSTGAAFARLVVKTPAALAGAVATRAATDPSARRLDAAGDAGRTEALAAR